MVKFKIVKRINAEEFINKALFNKNEFVGKIVIDKFGKRYRILDISEKGIQALPLNPISIAS